MSASAEKPLCIYHANCPDGFSAAWAAWRKHPDWSFTPAAHGDDPPDVAGREVYLLDFSYKAQVIEQMLEQGARISVLDHHQSARDALRGLIESARIGGVIDCERSGARIAWDFFHPGTPPPRLLLHIEDRDLWRFALPETHEISEALLAQPYSFAVWDMLMLSTQVEALAQAGRTLLRKKTKDIRELIEVAARRMVIAGHDVPVLNAPYFYASEAGHLLAAGEPFAASYYDGARARVFSLRSDANGEDVAAIAERYAGGGHRHAAGFRVPLGWEGDAP